LREGAGARRVRARPPLLSRRRAAPHRRGAPRFRCRARRVSTWWRSMRPYRFELGALVLIAATGVAFAGGTALRVMAFGVPNACFGLEKPESCIDYARAIDQYFGTLATWQVAATLTGLAFPSIAALLLGLALIGKEVDQRTTVFALSVC